MTLFDIEFEHNGSNMPAEIALFLHEADARITHYVQRNPVSVSGFVPSEPVTVFGALRAVSQANLATGNNFCEWGSGFGVVASLAALLDYSAIGIEIDAELVDESRRLAADFDLPTEFIQGSFIPPGGGVCADESYADNSSEMSWIVTDEDDAYSELGLDADDFDLIFAYPWPGEEHVIESLFDRYAAEGALLLTYSYLESIRLRRKIGEPGGSE